MDIRKVRHPQLQTYLRLTNQESKPWIMSEHLSPCKAIFVVLQTLYTFNLSNLLLSAVQFMATWCMGEKGQNYIMFNLDNISGVDRHERPLHSTLFVYLYQLECLHKKLKWLW